MSFEEAANKNGGKLSEAMLTIFRGRVDEVVGWLEEIRHEKQMQTERICNQENLVQSMTRSDEDGSF